jgi:hypothetical protein
MHRSLSYGALRARLRDYVGDKEALLDFLRMSRYALLQGPWQPLLIRHYQSIDRNEPMPVSPETLFPGVQAGDAIRELGLEARAHGFQVPAAMVEEIHDYAHDVGLKRIDDPHLDCGPVHRIAHDPAIVNVARGFLKAEPVLFDSKLYWTLPPADPSLRQRAAAEHGRFHYDLADFKALTVFVYLTDVDEESGPHVVIRGTHERRTPLQIMRRFIGDDDARRRYPNRMEVITGPRGTGWFEDITCYHKQMPGSKARLMLTLIYALQRRRIEGKRLRRFGKVAVASN